MLHQVFHNENAPRRCLDCENLLTDDDDDDHDLCSSCLEDKGVICPSCKDWVEDKDFDYDNDVCKDCMRYIK